MQQRLTEVPMACASRSSWGEVGRRRGASWAGPFPTAPSRTRHARFPGTGLSGDYTVEVAVGRPAWMLSWQETQATRVLRLRFAMICTQAGFSFRPGLLRSASLRMWWTSNRSVVPQTSQRPARSRWISSFPLVVTREGERSASTAFVCRRSGMPPNRATSGRFPLAAFYRDLEAHSGAFRRVDGGLVLAGHLRHRGVVLSCQGLEQRGLHDPP
jgi:hypothetical protein